MQQKNTVIGIDLGGTYTKLGLVTESGEMLIQKKFPTKADQPFDVFIGELKDILAEVKAEVMEKVVVKGIGIGAPVANCYTGMMENPSNFKWGVSVPLAKRVAEISGLEVFIHNDASVAALGEMQFGGARNMNHFVVVTLGTGVGSGFVINGQLHGGHRGMAGEMGHTIVVPGGRQCPCGLKGCLEQYASVTGTVKSAKQLLASESKASLLRDIPLEDLEGKDIFDAAQQGDEIALEAFNIAGRMLGFRLADTVAYFDPEAIFITGGLAKAGDMILNPTIEMMEENLFNIYRNRVKVLISELVHREGAVLGAAALALKELERT